MVVPVRKKIENGRNRVYHCCCLRKQTYFLLIFFSSSFLFLSFDTINDPVIWSDGFESEDWMGNWKIRNDKKWGFDNYKILKENNGTNSFLRVYFPQNSYSPNGFHKNEAPLGGMQFVSDIGSFDSIHLSYRLRFKQNFDFVKGGKLPGLCGGTANTGGKIPDGKDGFSSRIMWRTDGEGEVYDYLPVSETWGTSLGRGYWKFDTGKWILLEMQITLNEVGKNNGTTTIWINGKKVMKENNIVFRKTDNLKLDGILFSTFFGGNDSSWSTPEGTYIDFDDFVVSTSFIGKKI
jgi:hypothetical protein